MKKTLISFFLCLFCCITAFSIQHEEVVQVESTSKDILYERALRWFTYNMKSPENVIELKDKENGEVSGKFITRTTATVKGTLRDYVSALDQWIKVDIKITIHAKILCRDGRYRYILTSAVEEKQNGDNRATRPETKEKLEIAIEKETNDEFNRILESIKTHMATADSFEEEDW